MNSSDVTILYQGGSGGFGLFYFLLLSNNYVSGLPGIDVNILIEKQFGFELLEQPANWKNNEFWPDNQKCKDQARGPRLFLICNPTWTNELTQTNKAIAKGTHRILLYTDIRTQMRLAYDKRAYWFTDISRERFQAPGSNYKYIKQTLEPAGTYDPELENVRRFFRPNQELLLQDFLRTKHIPGFPVPNQSQADFLQRWLELQPPKSKQKLLS